MEIWDLVDEERRSLGKQHIRGNDTLPGEYHIVVEVWTFDPEGKLLLTQRDRTKTHPLLWERTGGSVTAGESSLLGAVRELEEETGLKAKPAQLHKLGELKRGNYFLDSYVWQTNDPIKLKTLELQDGEVCAAMLASWAEFRQMNDDGLIVPAVWERAQFYRKAIAAIVQLDEEAYL